MKKIFALCLIILSSINLSYAGIVPGSIKSGDISIPQARCEDNTSNACDDGKSGRTGGDTANGGRWRVGGYFRTTGINNAEGSDSNCMTAYKGGGCNYNGPYVDRKIGESRCQTTGERWMQTGDTDCQNPGASPFEQYESMVQKYETSSYRVLDQFRNTLCYNYGEAKKSGENYSDGTPVYCQTYCRSGGTATCKQYGSCYGNGKYGMIDDESPEYCSDSDDNSCHSWDTIFSNSNDSVWCNVDEYVRGTYKSGDKLNGCKIITGNNDNIDLLQKIKFFVRDKSGIRRIRIQLGACFADYVNTSAGGSIYSVSINTGKIYFDKNVLLNMFQGKGITGFTANPGSRVIKTSDRLDESCLANGKNNFSLEVWDGSLTNNGEVITGYPTTDFWKGGSGGNNTGRYNTVVKSQITANIDSNNSYVNISGNPAIISDSKGAAKGTATDIWKNYTALLQKIFGEDKFNEGPKNSFSSSENCYVTKDGNTIKCNGTNYNIEADEPSLCTGGGVNPCTAG